MKEFTLHMAIKRHYESCFIGAHNPNLKIMHIANEQRDATQGYWNKVLGVEKGFTDILSAWPKNVGVAEVKLPGAKLTSDQNRFLSWAALIGWHTGIFRTVHDAHMGFRKWGLNASRIYYPTEEPDYATKEEKLRRGESFFKP